MKRRVIIFYEFFYPAYKAGGPIQSIYNICNILNREFEIFVLCSDRDIDGSPLLNIELDTWNEYKNIKIFYLQEVQKSIGFIKSLIISIKPHVMYVNGVFSIQFAIYPLIIGQLYFKNEVKIIVSPRGMLQEGALKIRALKKSIFLGIFKTIKLQKGITWHATDEQESKDIKRIFGKNSFSHIISNIPKVTLETINKIEKLQGNLRLVFISLITEKKNIKFALKCLQEQKLPISFDIYGPIKDKSYWADCLKEIGNIPPQVSIQYKGDVLPGFVQHKLSEYHALFLPTKGENFGHAIYESFSVGRPVIISDKTPWRNLEAAHAGFDIPLEKDDEFKRAIGMLYNMEQEMYDVWCNGALNTAVDFYKKYDFKSEYTVLFS